MLTFLLLATILSDKPAQAENEDIKQIAESGRCVTVAEKPDERVAPQPSLPPGPPPLLGFRLYESKEHNRAGNSQLMLDDAGH